MAEDDSELKDHTRMHKRAKVVHSAEASAIEISRIRERDGDGFGTGMLAIEVETLLKSVRAPYDKLRPLEAALKVLKTDIESTPSKTLKANGKIVPSVLEKFPTLSLRSDKPDMSMKFLPPDNFTLAGSYLLRTVYFYNQLKNPSNIDVAVTIPKSCYYRTDYKHYRFHDRRLLYLVQLYKHLLKTKRWTSLSLQNEFLNDDPLQPVLSLQPKETVLREHGAEKPDDVSICEHFSIRIIPIIDVDGLPASKLRSASFDDDDVDDDDAFDKRMYLHGLSIHAAVVDHLKVMNEVQRHADGFQDAVLLLKAWRRRRSLPIRDFVLTAFLTSLLLDRTVPNTASVQHLVRSAFQHLANWTKAKALELYLEPDRRCNILASMSSDDTMAVGIEAKAALKALNRPGGGDEVDAWSGAYAALFSPVLTATVAEQFDAVVRIRPSRNLDRLRPDNRLLARQCGRIVRRALGKGCILALPRVLKDEIGIGLVMDGKWFPGRVMNVEETNLDVDSFRKFWGDRSELRRFKDGRIVEAVVWKAGGMVAVEEASRVALSKHVNGVEETDVRLVRREWEEVLPKLEGSAIAASRAADELGRALRAMENVPLKVSTVTFAGEVLLGTSVVGNGVVGSRCRPTSSVVFSFEGSSGWPEDEHAIRASKAAFYAAVEDSLRRQGIDARATFQSVEVSLSGYFFTIVVRHDRGLAYIQSEREREREVWQTVRRPRLFSALKDVRGDTESSPFQETCRIVKRWLSAHYLANHFADELVELIVARTFLVSESNPFGMPPRSSSTAFAAFLSILAHFPWESAPLVVDFEQNGDIHREAEKAFRKIPDRAKAAAMIVSTPGDLLGRSFSPWNGRGPERVVLRRAVAAAKATLSKLDTLMSTTEDPQFDLRTLFRSNNSGFNLRITLKEKCVGCAAVGIDAKKTAASAVKSGPLGSKKALTLSTVLTDFDPILALLSKLQSTFGQHALFFIDKYGSQHIGMVWRPTVFAEKPFSLFSLAYMKPVGVDVNGTAAKVVTNCDEIVETIRRLGGDIIEAIVKI